MENPRKLTPFGQNKLFGKNISYESADFRPLIANERRPFLLQLKELPN